MHKVLPHERLEARDILQNEDHARSGDHLPYSLLRRAGVRDGLEDGDEELADIRAHGDWERAQEAMDGPVVSAQFLVDYKPTLF